MSKPMDAGGDAAVVEAVRGGDRERYRELVERYGDKVFAIAWSRLGDHGLAEEAAQEAFIAGFRRLGFLMNAERFGSWIGTIARRTAINLGIRHRGELERRRRWALESEVEVERDRAEVVGADGDGALPNPETLRETLEKLPAVHRECLVLFYLENRGVAESAHALGISENAFKVRLHRARGVLRQALENRLEQGLRRLRAPSRLVSAVMLGLPVSAGTGAGGLLGLGAVGSTLGKLLPLGYIMLAVQVVAMLPGLLLAWWLGRSELENFRDPAGFRRHFYRRFLRRLLFFVAGMALLTFFLSRGLNLIVLDQAERWGIDVAGMDLGIRPYCLLFGLFSLVSSLDYGRRMRCIRHPLVVCTALGLGVFAVSFFTVAIFKDATHVLFFGQGIFFLLMSFGIPKALPRMDYSLFTRAAHGLLTRPGEPVTPMPASPGREAAELMAFARFLGDRMLIEDWRRVSGGLELRLNRVVQNFVAGAIPFYWRGASRLFLRDDGTVAARLHASEDADLERSLAATPARLPSRDLEDLVASAVGAAWRAFRRGDRAAAEAALGERAESSIFRKAPAKAFPMRARVWVLRGAAILMPVFGARMAWFTPPMELRAIEYKKPVAITETDVRGFLGNLAAAAPTNEAYWDQFQYGLHRMRVLPGRDLFSADALEVARERLARIVDMTARAEPLVPADVVGVALGDRAFLTAAMNGLYEREALERRGLSVDGVRAGMVAMTRNRARWRHVLELAEHSVHGQEAEGRKALGVQDYAARVEFLERMGCLDLLDLEPAVQTLVWCQVLPENSLTNRWRVPDRQEWHGLFVTTWSETLLDTRDALTVLRAAGALDRIDREACIQGILRFHRGKGLFVPHGAHPGVGARGEAVETYAAFESLRMLGGLDRVKDLARWEFRPTFPQLETQTRQGLRVLPAEHVVAWTLREAFRREMSAAVNDPSPAPAARSNGRGGR